MNNFHGLHKCALCHSNRTIQCTNKWIHRYRARTKQTNRNLFLFGKRKIRFSPGKYLIECVLYVWPRTVTIELNWVNRIWNLRLRKLRYNVRLIRCSHGNLIMQFKLKHQKLLIEQRICSLSLKLRFPFIKNWRIGHFWHLFFLENFKKPISKIHFSSIKRSVVETHIFLLNGSIKVSSRASQ